MDDVFKNEFNNRILGDQDLCFKEQASIENIKNSVPFSFLEILIQKQIQGIYATGYTFFVLSYDLDKIIWLDQRSAAFFDYKNFFHALGAPTNFDSGTKALIRFGLKSEEFFQLDSAFDYQEFSAQELVLLNGERAILIQASLHLEDKNPLDLVLLGLNIDNVEAAILNLDGEPLHETEAFSKFSSKVSNKPEAILKGSLFTSKMLSFNHEKYVVTYFILNKMMEQYLVIVSPLDTALKLSGQFPTNFSEKDKIFPFASDKNNFLKELFLGTNQKVLQEETSVEDKNLEKFHHKFYDFVELSDHLEFLSAPRPKICNHIASHFLTGQEISSSETKDLIKECRLSSFIDKESLKHDELAQKKALLPKLFGRKLFLERSFDPLENTPRLQIISKPKQTMVLEKEKSLPIKSLSSQNLKDQILTELALNPTVLKDELQNVDLYLDDKGFIETIGEKMAHFLGYEQKRLQGKSFFDYLAKESHDFFSKQLISLQEQDFASQEILLENILLLRYGVMKINVSLILIAFNAHKKIGLKIENLDLYREKSLLLFDDVSLPIAKDKEQSKIENCESNLEEKTEIKKQQALAKISSHSLIVFESILQKLQPKANENGIIVRYSLAHDLKDTVLESEKLQLIFYSLFANAIEFTPLGGRIVISAENDKDSDVFIRISDSGKGIAPEFLERLNDLRKDFEVEDNLLSERKKLDLFSIKALIEQSGGRFMILSRLNEGTTISILLPQNRDR